MSDMPLSKFDNDVRIKAHPLAPFGIGPPLLDISEKLLGCRLLLVSSNFFRRTSAMFASIVTCISCQCRGGEH